MYDLETGRKYILCGGCGRRIYAEDEIYEQDDCYQVEDRVLCESCFEEEMERRKKESYLKLAG